MKVFFLFGLVIVNVVVSESKMISSIEELGDLRNSNNLKQNISERSLCSFGRVERTREKTGISFFNPYIFAAAVGFLLSGSSLELCGRLLFLKPTAIFHSMTY